MPLHGYGMYDSGGSGSERNGRRLGEPIPLWPGSTPSVLGLVTTPSVNGGHSVAWGDSRSASKPINDVHQARMTKVFGDGG